MNKLVYFYIIYLAFFFVIYLIYDLSAFLTPSPIPTPSFLFYSPFTSEIFLGVQLLVLPILFVIFYFLTGRRCVVGLVLAYVVVLIMSYFLPAFSVLSALISIGFFVIAIGEATSKISKVLWGASSVYVMAMVLSVPFYPVFLMPSLIASGIEAYRLSVK